MQISQTVTIFIANRYTLTVYTCQVMWYNTLYADKLRLIMKTVLFYLNVITCMPLLFVISFLSRLVKAIQTAFKHTLAECAFAYKSNARYYGR